MHLRDYLPYRSSLAILVMVVSTSLIAACSSKNTNSAKAPEYSTAQYLTAARDSADVQLVIQALQADGCTISENLDDAGVQVDPNLTNVAGYTTKEGESLGLIGVTVDCGDKGEAIFQVILDQKLDIVEIAALRVNFDTTEADEAERVYRIVDHQLVSESLASWAVAMENKIAAAYEAEGSSEATANFDSQAAGVQRGLSIDLCENAAWFMLSWIGVGTECDTECLGCLSTIRQYRNNKIGAFIASDAVDYLTSGISVGVVLKYASQMGPAIRQLAAGGAVTAVVGGLKVGAGAFLAAGLATQIAIAIAVLVLISAMVIAASYIYINKSVDKWGPGAGEESVCSRFGQLLCRVENGVDVPPACAENGAIFAHEKGCYALAATNPTIDGRKWCVMHPTENMHYCPVCVDDNNQTVECAP